MNRVAIADRGKTVPGFALLTDAFAPFWKLCQRVGIISFPRDAGLIEGPIGANESLLFFGGPRLTVVDPDAEEE